MINKNKQLSEKLDTLNDFQKLLLTESVLNQEELKFIADKKAHFNQWK